MCVILQSYILQRAIFHCYKLVLKIFENSRPFAKYGRPNLTTKNSGLSLQQRHGDEISSWGTTQLEIDNFVECKTP